jgi:hypothetical protein
MVCDMAGRRNDYLDEDVPDPDEPDSPSEDLPLPASSEAGATSPASPRDAAPAPPARRSDSVSGWDLRKMMWLAGGSALMLKSVITRSETHMPTKDMPVASERAGGESRRAGLKRKAAEITRSAAEDFALLTTRTTSERSAADFLSTVAHVTSNFLLFA